MRGTQMLMSLRANEEAYELYFKKVILTDGAKYFLKAVNNKGDVIAFEMKKNKYGEWKILPPAPKVIVAWEQELCAAIEQQEKAADKG